MIIWHVLEGPYQTPYDDEEHYRLLCKVQTDEEDSKITREEIVFHSFKGAYEIKKYFDTNINPLDDDTINLLIDTALGVEDEQDERAN